MTSPEPIIFQAKDFVSKVARNALDFSTLLSSESASPIDGGHDDRYSKPDETATVNRMDDICNVDIIPSPNTLPWILGDAFLRRVDAIFDASPGNPVVGLRTKNPQNPLISQLYSNHVVAGASLKGTNEHEIVTQSNGTMTDSLIPPLKRLHNDSVLTGDFKSSNSSLADKKDSLDYKISKDSMETKDDVIIYSFISLSFLWWLTFITVTLGTTIGLLWTCGCFKRIANDGDMRLVNKHKPLKSLTLGIGTCRHIDHCPF